MPDFIDDFSRMLGAESGNKQFDQSGKPLKSKKGAVGIAQVMPSTGPEAARLAGLPWDPSRLETDKQYNSTLGAAYYRHLTQVFDGDSRAAVAAYNAGPTRVKNLKQRYGTEWEAHLPDETQDYLAEVKGVVSSPIRMVDPGASTVAVEPYSGTRAAAGQVFDPFGRAPEIAGQVSRVEDKSRNALDVLEVANSQIQESQATQEQQLAQSVAAKKAMYDTQEAQAKSLGEKLAPIFKRRGEIAARKVELAQMNPIKRELFGIFDRNYSTEYLDSLDQSLGQQASEMGQEYEINNRLSETALNIISGRFSGDQALEQLRVSNAGQDVALAEQSLQFARGQLNDTMEAIKTGTGLTQAQILLREDTLAKSTETDLTNMAAQARKSGGTALVNGVPLSLAEITQRQRQLAGQQMAFETQTLALQSQKLNIADAQESRLIDHMSTSDLKSVIAADGMYNGVKLSMSKLTGALTSAAQRAETQAVLATNNVDGATYTKTIDSFNSVIQQTMGRIGQVTGQRMPAEFKTFSGELVQMAAEAQRQIHAAAPEAKGLIRAKFLQTVRERMTKMDGTIDKVAQGMTRDPDAQILLGAYLKGNTLTPEQATKGVLGLGRGGALPPGVRFSDPAGAAIKAGVMAAQAVSAKYDPSTPANQKLIAQGQKIPKPNKDALFTEQMKAVKKAMNGQWVGGYAGNTVANLPATAKEMNHPFGALSMSDYRAAQAAGDQAGMAAAADKLGLTIEQAKAVFGDKSVTPSKAGLTPEQFTLGKQIIKQVAVPEMLRAIDRSQSGQAMLAQGIRPSEQLVDFMHSKQFQAGLQNMDSQIGKGTFGDMIVDSVTQGGIGEQVNLYGRVLANAQGQVIADDQKAIRDKAGHYASNPIKRLGVILGAIPGLNPMEEKELTDAVREVVGYGGTQSALLTADQILRPFAQRPASAGWNEMIDSVITTHKFENPRLEKIRQRAAADWKNYSDSTDRAMDRLNSAD